MKLHVGLIGLSFLILGACHDKKPAEGPVERAGKKVDNAAEETKGAAKDVKDDIKKHTDGDK